MHVMLLLPTAFASRDTDNRTHVPSLEHADEAATPSEIEGHVWLVLR